MSTWKNILLRRTLIFTKKKETTLTYYKNWKVVEKLLIEILNEVNCKNTV